MLEALDSLPLEQDRKALQEVLRTLLLKGTVPLTELKLSPEGQRWFRLATMREDESDPELVTAIEAHLSSLCYNLSPNQSLEQLRCRVFLVHGATDDLIPPEESRALNVRLKNSHLLISPFLTHTHPSQSRMSWRQKAGAFWNMLAFFYSFASVAR